MLCDALPNPNYNLVLRDGRFPTLMFISELQRYTLDSYCEELRVAFEILTLKLEVSHAVIPPNNSFTCE